MAQSLFQLPQLGDSKTKIWIDWGQDKKDGVFVCASVHPNGTMKVKEVQTVLGRLPRTRNITRSALLLAISKMYYNNGRGVPEVLLPARRIIEEFVLYSAGLTSDGEIPIFVN